LIVGCFMEMLAAMIIRVPVFASVIKAMGIV
jgi:TRAP-type C4-dicarboxylate transport system permease large subunit